MAHRAEGWYYPHHRVVVRPTRRHDVRSVGRTTVLIDLLVHHMPVAVVCERWDLSLTCLYGWQQALLLGGSQ